MALCGDPAGPPALPPLFAAPRIAGVAEEIGRLTAARGRPVRVVWEAALSGRAAILGLSRQGRTSANGSCRLLRAADGDVALNLPRPDDMSLIPALTCDPGSETRPWEASAAFAMSVPAAEFVARARLLGLAASVAGERSWRRGTPDPTVAEPYTTVRRGEPRLAESHQRLTGSRFRVVDMSALWAGPVAARVLAEAGAEVIKVEDISRPDAARQRPEFYSWIHPLNETTERLDLTSTSGRQRLLGLLEAADVVIESSRTRALEQMGLGADQLQAPEGQVWLGLTAHGRDGSARDWIGFGDDAAAAGSLLCRDPNGGVTFCGDAIADPVAGLVGAMAVLRCLAGGGGHLIDVSLSGAAAWAAAGSPPVTRQSGFAIDRSADGWVLRQGDLNEPIAEGPPTLQWIETLDRV